MRECFLEPVGQGMKVLCEARKLAYRLVVSIRWYGDKVRGAADVDASGVGVGYRQSGSGWAQFEGDAVIAFCHGLLHYSLGKGRWLRIGYVV